MKFFSGKNEGGYKDLKIKLPDWFEDNGVDFKETSTGEVIIEDCPSCNRTYKLYVEPETGVAQCKYAGCEFNDGISPITLVSKLLNISKGKAFTICYGKKEKKAVSKDDILGDDWLSDITENQNIKEKKKKKELKEIEFPPLVEDLTEQHKTAWEYLMGRGMSKEDIEVTQMKIIPFEDSKKYWTALVAKGYSPEEIKKYTRYLNRVIFPVKVEEKLFGYVARDFTNKVPKKYKVMNSEGSFRAEVFWNFNNVKDSHEIVICEGFMDAVKAGVDRSIAILGADMSEGQFNLLRKTSAKKVIMCLDIGTKRKQNNIFDNLFLDFPGAIYKVELPPLLTQKDNLLNDNIKKILEELSPEEISYFKNNELYLDYSVFEDVKDKIENSPSWFLSGNNALSKYELDNLKTFVKKAEYKDAGDYSKEEMNEFIKNAVLFQKYRDIDL